MGTWIVLLFLGVAVVFAARTMIKNQKKGKMFSCGGDCRRCLAGCKNKKKKA